MPGCQQVSIRSLFRLRPSRKEEPKAAPLKGNENIEGPSLNPRMDPILLLFFKTEIYHVYAYRNIRTFQKRLDGQLIDIKRISQSKSHADYEVTSTLWDIDPRFRSRNIKAGTASGILRIKKDTGDIAVVYPMSFDHNGQILLKAKTVLLKAFEKGEFPEKTGFASG